MRQATRLIGAVTALAVTLTAGVAPTTSAQDEGCALLTVAEVEAALDVTGLEDGSSGSLCSFSGDGLALYVILQPGMDLDALRDQYSDAVEATVSGHPALSSADGNSIMVELPGQVIVANYYGGMAWEEAEPAVTGLLELAITRAPEGPSQGDIDRLKALIPSAIAGFPVTIQSFGGDLLFGFMDETDASVIALHEALAAQGRSTSDVLFVGGETDDEDDDHAVIAVLIKDADAAPLVEPVFRVFAVANDAEATFTPTEVAGRPAVEVGGVAVDRLVVASSGDIILAAAVPDSELETVIAALP